MVIRSPSHFSPSPCVSVRNILTNSQSQSCRMPRSSSIHLLSIFVCCVASLSLLPGPDHQLSNITTSPLAAPGICTSFKLFYTRPKWRDCDTAIDSLSSSRDVCNFHQGGEVDDWQLPVSDIYETCYVYTEITQSSLGETSSWYEIKTAARKLNDDCRKKKILGDITGGVVRIGEHGWIRISIRTNVSGGKVKGE